MLYDLENWQEEKEGQRPVHLQASFVKTASQQRVTMGVNTGKRAKQSMWKEGCIYICEDSL